MFDNDYNICYCLDVLEHIPLDQIEKSLDNLFKLKCKTWVLSISCRPSGILGPNKENLHLTVWKHQVWQKAILERDVKITYNTFDQNNKCLYLKIIKK